MSSALQTAGEPTPARLVLTLSLAGLLSGLIIVAVFEATLPSITAYQAQQSSHAKAAHQDDQPLAQ